MRIRLGKVKGLPHGETARGWNFRATADAVHLFWQEVGQFLILGGSEIVVEPHPGVDPALLRLFLLGPVMAALLHYRGVLVLHASAVAMGGKAFAFLGETGWGKSTLAAALYTQGCAMVTDDVAPVQLDADQPLIFPGFPQIKLWPDAAAALSYSPEALPQIDPEEDKRMLRASRGFSSAPLPLARIYILEADSAPEKIEPIKPQELLIELVRHTYCPQFLPATGASSHFLQCASLARQVAGHRLYIPQSLRTLAKLTRKVEADLGLLN